MHDYNLVIIGSVILKKELLEEIEKLNLNKKITLLGQKNMMEIIEIYNNSEIFISSSVWEGFAKVIIEAMGCGCKVIATDVGSSKLLLEDWGYLIEHSSSNEITEALRRIIDDDYPFTKQEVSVNRFSWNSIRSTYYESIDMLE